MKKLLFFAIALVLFAQCDTDELHELNINPQALNQIDLNFMFTAAQLAIASNGSSGDNRYTDWRTNINMCAHAIQHVACACGNAGERYTENLETNAAPFEFTYRDQLKNIAEILKQTGDGGYDAGNKKNQRNASRILKVFSLARLVDFYGNVPYSEANQGLEGLFFPKYDDGKAVYTDLLRDLDEATAALNASEPDQGFKAADLLFNGDISKWKKWGYSQMLRMAMRASNADQALATTYVNKAIAGGLMTSNADNVIVPMALSPSEWTNQNGISRAFYPGDGGAATSTVISKTMIDFLKGTDKTTVADDDPRLMIITGGIIDWQATTHTILDANPLNQRGLPNGLEQADIDRIEGKQTIVRTTFSSVNFKMMQDDEPYMIMNYGEVKLLLAEAKQRGIGTVSGTAKEHYDAGVKAAMQMYTIYDPTLSVTDDAVAAYLTTYQYGVHKPAIEMIGEQLWVSKFLNWWDAWSDWRRLNFPTLTPVIHPANITNGTIPVRLKYPNAEVGSNPHYQTTATQPDLYTTKVWWDVN